MIFSCDLCKEIELFIWRRYTLYYIWSLTASEALLLALDCLETVHDMRILIVEDNHQTRQLLLYLLQERFMEEAKFREASDLKTAFQYLHMWKDVDRRSRIDGKSVDPICIVLDLSLPDSVGRETFLKFFKSFPDIPIVVMTNTNDRALAEEMVDMGAQDYILKNFTDEEEVFRRISFAIRRHQRSVSLPPPDANSIHRLESAKAELLSAHESGEHKVLEAKSTELLSGMTELVKKTFVSVQEVNIKQEKLSLSQEHMGKEIQTLTDEVTGSGGRRSMRSEIEIVNVEIDGIKSDFRELKVKVGKVEEDKKDEVKNKEAASVQLKTSRMNNRTKIILAALSLLGMLITAWLAIKYRVKLKP